jgi:hypothetical protein
VLPQTMAARIVLHAKFPMSGAKDRPCSSSILSGNQILGRNLESKPIFLKRS